MQWDIRPFTPDDYQAMAERATFQVAPTACYFPKVIR